VNAAAISGTYHVQRNGTTGVVEKLLITGSIVTGVNLGVQSSMLLNPTQYPEVSTYGTRSVTPVVESLSVEDQGVAGGVIVTLPTAVLVSIASNPAAGSGIGFTFVLAY
jgi:hypothetical protein